MDVQSFEVPGLYWLVRGLLSMMGTSMAFHIALLGDSIFDNSSYMRGEPDVVNHLRSLLPADWRASLLAVDGSVTDDLAGQFRRVSTDVTHLVISMGETMCSGTVTYWHVLFRP